VTTVRFGHVRWPARPTPPRPAFLRRLAILFAVALISSSFLLAGHATGGDLSVHRLLATPLNKLIAWADLNLELWPRGGAERALRLDPKLRTRLGRQGARWFATNGSIAERLHYAARLAARDPRELPLLRAAVDDGLCAHDRRLRKAAVAAARRGGLAPRPRKGRRRC
jgi:hypothetical protein